MARVLIVDDEKSIRATLREILSFENYTVSEAPDGEQALALLQQQEFDVVLCDIKMPRMDGLTLLERYKSKPENKAQFIMISAHGTIDTAVEATKMGAYDFLVKPPDLNRLLVTVRNAADKSNLLTETTILKEQVAKTSEIVGESEAINRIKAVISRVAPTDARVLITGPNGSGKELVARAIHQNSNRTQYPLVVVNCAAIPGELIESELFGHEKGSFTSAVKQHIGKFEQAHRGTLFLDEIGDMSPATQAKVLRALQENRIARVGGDDEIVVDVRVIAATNKNLRAEIAAGRFREDLFHRLNVIPIQVPPLNDRREDIPLLITRFLHDIASDYGYAVPQITPAAVRLLQNLNYTGNIRELRNIVERLVIMCGPRITEDDARLYTAIGKA